MPMVTVLNPCPSVNAMRSRRSLLALSVLAFLGLNAQAADELTLTLAPGDTLIGISQRYLAQPQRWPALKRLNHVADDLHLQPGAKLQIPMAWLRWSERAADIIHVQGEVLGADRRLAVGMQLKAGDTFDTGAAGVLTLRLPDGATVVFPPHTQAGLGVSREVTGTRVRATTIELQNGATDSTVPPLKESASRFEIRTPRVVTAVRGTRFRVATDGVSSRHEVVSGVVAVAGASGNASLNAAQGVVTDSGRLGAVVPLLPAADLSGVPLRIERTAQSLSVPPLAGAQGWRWQVALDATFTRLLQDEKTSAPTWLLTSLPDGDYHLRLRAADAQGLEGREASQMLALRARPEPPIQMSPAAGASVVGAVTLVWAEQVDAPGYQLQVARDARFTDLVLDRTDLTGSRLALEEAWAPGTYHWRMATLRAKGEPRPFAEGPRGPLGDSASFTVLPPSAMAPPEVGEGGVKLAWTGPQGFSHHVQVASDAGFSLIELDQVVPGARLDLPTPPSGVHFVRTQVVLSDQRVGPWSAAQRFEVPAKHPWG